MIRLFAVLAAVGCLVCGPCVSAEEISKEKRVDIEHLMKVTGALALGQQMSDAVVANMTQMLRESRPDIPPEMFDVLREEVNGVIDDNLPSFAELVTQLYHKHFTHEDIKGLIRFYDTALGRKTIAVMPALMQESLMLGQQWGQSLGPLIQRRVIERFKSEGVDLSA
jgi:hypothetical protein